MFEHLPIITEDNARGMAENELDYFHDRLREGTEQSAASESEVFDYCCSELYELNNPYLAKAVGAIVSNVAEELKGKVDPGAEWRIGLTAVPGALAILRLIDRALESEEYR